MLRGNLIRPRDTVPLRSCWIIPPLVGRLVPLALQASEGETGATLFPVRAAGLSETQIDDRSSGNGASSHLLVTLSGIPAALLRYLLSKALRHPGQGSGRKPYGRVGLDQP